MRAKLTATILLALAAAFGTIATPAWAADPVLGRWMTQDRAAIVRIGMCGGTVCGVAERVLDPKAPTNDINNPDPKLRSRPIAGSMILSGFSRDGDEWSGGQAYSPKIGKSFRSSLKVMPDRRLRVTGCVFVICKSIYWTRVG